MSEKPIERLNYFNGQRLEAEDLRLEQEYHMRIQRWLSKSLFSPGLADGYDVSIDDEESHYVIVTPGLVLDDLGRAIVLVAARRLKAQAAYLCVRYAEQPAAPQSGACTVRSGSSTVPAAWAGPSRVLAEPEFVWRRNYPTNDAREIMIARLEMTEACVVSRVAEGPRKMAVASQVSRVYSYALEGEKDIDSENSKVIRFHINGRRPNAVYLVLRGAVISGLHYTELALHHHPLVVSGNSLDAPLVTEVTDTLDPHDHSGTTLAVTATPEHTHTISSRVGPVLQGVLDGYNLVVGRLPDDTGNRDLTGGVNEFVVKPILEQPHSITENVGPAQRTGDFAHKHRIVVPAGKITITASSLDEGNTLLPVTPADPKQRPFRAGEQYSYLADLRILIGETRLDCTDAILKQLTDGPRSHIWQGVLKFGSGGAIDPFVDHGTGLIRLDVLPGVDFPNGEHVIELKVKGAGSGGSVHYNLYVE